MKTIELKKIGQFCFGIEEIAKALQISLPSAKVAASRYTRQGALLRIKKNMYVMPETWNAAGKEEKFRIANLGQVPSYISLMTALDYYEITTQVQQEYFESVAVKRSRQIEVDDTTFVYVKLAPDLYHGFIKTRGFFIATPEKALLDAFYLTSYGRYSLDIAALDASRFDLRELQRLAQHCPTRTQSFLANYGYLPPT